MNIDSPKASSQKSAAKVVAKEVKMSRQGVQKALSAKGNPRFDSINAIIRAMGYRLMPQRVGETAVAESRAEYEVE